MSSLSDYAENVLLNYEMHGTAPPDAGPFYLALFLTNPTDANAGSEVSGSNYSRVSVSGKFPVASGASGALINNADIVFPTPSGDWGNVGYVGLMTAASGGNLWRHAALNTTRNILANDAPKFLSGELTFEYR